MRKTIFALALFTVILSFYVSKAELFLEDVELVEFEDEELGDTTTKTSTPKGSEKKAKTPTKTTEGTGKKATGTKPKAGTTTTKPTKGTTKAPAKKPKAGTTPPKTAPKKSSTMKWVIIAVVVVLVGVAIWYFACRDDPAKKAEVEKDKKFKGEQASH